MPTSARNQLSGRVTAAITKDSVESLGLVEGSQVKAIIKATDVMIGTD